MRSTSRYRQCLTVPARGAMPAATLAVLLVGLVACPAPDDAPSSPEPAATEAATQAATQAATGESDAGLKAASRLTLDELNPTIREVGPSGQVPDRIEIRLARPLPVSPSDRPSENTVVSIKPAVDGEWRFTAEDRLVFTPKAGFRPQTEYVVTLEALQGEGKQKISGPRSVERVFTTPPLELRRFEVMQWDPDEGKARLALTFSGPVEIKRTNRLRWKVDGIARRIKVQKTARPFIWTANIVDADLEAGSEIEVVILGGAVTSAVDKKIRVSGSKKVSLPEDEAMYVRTAAVVEGADGFLIKVICHDDASEGDEIGFWDRDLGAYFEVSPRCVLDEDSAKAKLRFEPPVDFRVSPTRGGFRVHAPFKRGAVRMTLEAGARTVDGANTVSRFQRSFTIPARKPRLEFVAQGRYLPTSAWGGLGLRHQNVSKAEVKIRHVTRDNIVGWLADSGDGTNYRNSDLLVKQGLTLSGEDDVLSTTVLPLDTYLAKPPPGVVDIEVSDTEKSSAKTNVRFAVTDLNVLAKRHVDGTVNAWVLDAHSHRPVPGVEVELVVYSGRQISKCRTRGDGGCVLTGVSKDAVDATQPFALIAKTKDDFTFLRFDQLRLDTSGYDVQGVKSSSADPYRAAIYTDRGVYRPSETAHVVAILRDENNRAPPTDMPVQVELIDPKRKVSKRRTLKTNPAGILATDFTFADFAATGRYQVVYKAAKRTLGAYAFNVEEFVPERMEVTASTSKSDFSVEEEAGISVSARYLFGGTAGGSRVELRCRLVPTKFTPSQHPGYVFEVWREKPGASISLGKVDGELDDEGATEVACPSLSGRGRVLGAAELRAQVAVFESGSGRTTLGRATAKVHPSAVYIGLKSNVDRVKPNRSFKVDGVIVDWTGAVADVHDSVSLELLLVEREYGWTYDEAEGRWINRRHAHLVRSKKLEVPVKKGRFQIELSTPESATGYVVRARTKDAQGDLKLGGSWSYWYDAYGSSDETPRPQKPGTLNIKAPRETRVGETVQVSVNVPYAGRLLWTLESEGVIESKWRDVEPGRQEWSFEVDAFRPNVYVSALLLKDPHEESKESFIPSRAYAVRSIRVRPEAYLQKVEVNVPTEIRSNQPLEVEVVLPEAERPSYVTVAAIDEGILSLTKFETPDPAAELFKRRALGVDTFETVGWNVSLPAGDLGRSTGGGGPGAPGRVQMVKPVALWSGLRKVPDKGPLKVRFDVPRYRGKLRVMVVGAGPTKLVSASRPVIVRDPIVMQTTLPRFLVQGDQAIVPVFLTNLSGKAQNVSVTFSSTPVLTSQASATVGPAVEMVEVRGPKVRQLKLEKDGQATVVFRLDAKGAVGAARLRVEVKAPGVTVDETLDVPFVPNAPRTKIVQRLPLPPGELDLTSKLAGWLPTTESTTFWVTANPYGEVFDHLGYLIRYPYGCVEQTTSATRPLLFLGRLVRDVSPDEFDGAKLEEAVARGIDRVLSMQTPSGGFGYWPGASRPVHWGTAYATHMLIDAKKQGFSVPQDRIDEALTWMRRALTTSGRSDTALMHAEPYMHYVLALSGRGAKAEMLDLVESLKTKDADGSRDEMVFLLRAGLYLAGDQRFEAELLTPDTRPIRSDRSNGWSFYSDRRRRGLMLSVLADIFGPRPELQPLAEVVAEGLRSRDSYWYTTQELVWGITGLGQMLRDVTKSFAPPTLAGNGKAIEPAQVPDPKKDLGDRSFSVYRASEYGSLTLTARHDADDRVFLIVSSEGVRPDTKWRTGGDSISVKRTYRDERGEVIRPGQALDLGDLVYVEISLRNKTGESITNVAVVDRFAAALEVENPRLGRDARVNWFDQRSRWYPDHMNLRDDRIEAFGTLAPRRTVKLLYLLRAVTAGEFSVLPVEAEAMYDPSLWARQRGPSLTVRGPWDSE